MKIFETLQKTEMGKGALAIYTCLAIVILARAGYMTGHWLARH